MTEKQQAITSCVNMAINQFNFKEKYLISRDLSERCICAKFMRYLEDEIANSQFQKYTVDVEYNRGNQGNEYASKRLNGRNIVVDLIVHKRGYSKIKGFQNLICIEMKKTKNHPDMTQDKQRLEIMTDSKYGFGYSAGFMIVADADKRRNMCELRIETSFYNREIN
ncbi:hypothetical protein [Pygmaiobacter massiliensis]|uniref:hypothetical protein n=1 Tax=Pygmaiobacter massiliensis TaxID=1917873 RepID=UPI002A83FD5D|nr:hypothetical protein [Pygmaiobacter massiliensis]MDY4783390.1 hypothetical protein [Pygmaiobacter massiliensis]